MENMLYWRRSRRLTTLTSVMLAVCTPLVALAATPGSVTPKTIPEVRSHAYYILDESASSVLAARNERVAVPIASITKLMTALVVLEAGQPMDQWLTINADDVRGTAGNASRLAAGYKLSRRDLLHLALMSSENRAAYALCRSYPRGLRACVQAMNMKAAALGMRTAHFVEPTGLSSRNVASPEDLAKLVLAAAGNRTISEYSTSAVTCSSSAIPTCW
jgi:serine-type D-Ala-D-Ala endopeptidase (penicillin-binding protein 7)